MTDPERLRRAGAAGSAKGLAITHVRLQSTSFKATHVRIG